MAEQKQLGTDIYNKGCIWQCLHTLDNYRITGTFPNGNLRLETMYGYDMHSIPFTQLKYEYTYICVDAKDIPVQLGAAAGKATADARAAGNFICLPTGGGMNAVVDGISKAGPTRTETEIGVAMNSAKAGGSGNIQLPAGSGTSDKFAIGAIWKRKKQGYKRRIISYNKDTFKMEIIEPASYPIITKEYSATSKWLKDQYEFYSYGTQSVAAGIPEQGALSSTAALTWKEQGFCPTCGEKGSFISLQLVCTKHGGY